MSMTTLNDQDVCACGLLLGQGTAHLVAQASAAISETEAGVKPSRLGGQRPGLVALRPGESHTFLGLLYWHCWYFRALLDAG